MNSFGSDKGVTIRLPSTANLMIDSKDRDENRYSSPWDFQINKTQNVQNGFMTRVGTTEVVLEWYEPNIVTPNNELIVDICGTGLVSNQPITLPQGFYSVAEALNYIVQELNDLSGTSGVHFDITPLRSLNSEYELLAIGGEFSFGNTFLANQLGLYLGPGPGNVPSIALYHGIDLRRYRYLDFTSSQLTYNQDLKDNSTADINRDVLCRWYMAYDNSQVLDVDEYGFPLLMGYAPFVLRRLFNPPKQIKWDAIQPIGNLSFQVYGNDGNLVEVEDAGNSQWLMTLQLSEN